MTFEKNGTLLATRFILKYTPTLNFKTYFNILLSEALKCV